MENTKTEEILSNLIRRRKDLTSTVIPALKQKSKDYRNAFKIWDIENEVKEIDWLLKIFTNKGYVIAD